MRSSCCGLDVSGDTAEQALAGSVYHIVLHLSGSHLLSVHEETGASEVRNSGVMELIESTWYSGLACAQNGQAQNPCCKAVALNIPNAEALE